MIVLSIRFFHMYVWGDSDRKDGMAREQVWGMLGSDVGSGAGGE